MAHRQTNSGRSRSCRSRTSRETAPAHGGRNLVSGESELFFDNLLVRIHFIIEMIWWTGLAPWEFEFPFPGSLTSTFLISVTSFRKRSIFVPKTGRRLHVYPLQPIMCMCRLHVYTLQSSAGPLPVYTLQPKNFPLLVPVASDLGFMVWVSGFRV